MNIYVGAENGCVPFFDSQVVLNNTLQPLVMSSASIFEAAAAGDIQYLKSHSSELSAKNNRGWTALHFAARYGQLDVVTYLVEQKVPTDVTNSEGKVLHIFISI